MWYSPKLKLAVILILYVVLALFYSVVTPIGRGADEWAHFWYAQFIADQGRLPASAAEREAAGYKSDWPPLYHLLAAGVTAWVDTTGPPTLKYREATIRRQLVPAFGPEAILHTEDESFPWRQEILVWHLGRLLSIIFSTGSLVVTYQIALNIFAALPAVPGNLRTNWPSLRIPTTHTLALVTVATVAFNPRFLFTGMLFNYDSLTILLSTVFLWLAIRVVKGCCLRWGFWGLGVLAGLALVTKYLTMLLPLAIVYVAASSRKQSGRKFWKNIGQAALAYVLAAGWWFAYLLVSFNEIDAYGPVLGILAPLIRGDGSDRTVETIFAWLSGGQAPPPAYLEQQSYATWELFFSFWQTFWGNPIATPYALNWFIVVLTGVSLLAAVGLWLLWRFLDRDSLARRLFILLGLICLLPLPFVAARLFGARDALEAVQGRHILFLAAPALMTLLVAGLNAVVFLVTTRRGIVVDERSGAVPARSGSKLLDSLPIIVNAVLVGFLLTGAILQLILISQIYPPLLPVQTTMPKIPQVVPNPVTLPGGASLLGFDQSLLDQSQQVTLFWRGGDDFAPEDYRLELQLVGEQGVRSGWYAFQTQARYPTRAWEPGDVIRDIGYLPLAELAGGEYRIEWRLAGSDGPLFDWQVLAPFSLNQMIASPEPEQAFTVWKNGRPVNEIPVFGERETIQITTNDSIAKLVLVGPDGNNHEPALAGEGWANYVVQPIWPAGDYRLQGHETVALRVVPGHRTFDLPAETIRPLTANFENKISLLGYQLQTRRVKPGDGLPVTLYWQALDWLAEDFVIFTRLLDNQQAARGGYDRLAKEAYSTLLWAPGEVVTDGFAVPVAADAPAGIYWLSIGWYRPVEGEAHSLPLVNAETGEPTGATSVMIGPVKVGGPPEGLLLVQPEPTHKVGAVLGDQIKLLGYDLDHADDLLRLTFYWEAVRVPDQDYTVFVHVRNMAGEVVAQMDQPPLDGAYPTGLWDSGEIVGQPLAIPLDGLAAGDYEIVTGMYDFASGQRLWVDGSVEGTVALETISVTPK